MVLLTMGEEEVEWEVERYSLWEEEEVCGWEPPAKERRGEESEGELSSVGEEEEG